MMTFYQKKRKNKEGYSVKDNTGEDKDEFPYIVSKD